MLRNKHAIISTFYRVSMAALSAVTVSSYYCEDSRKQNVNTLSEINLDSSRSQFRSRFRAITNAIASSSSLREPTKLESNQRRNSIQHHDFIIVGNGHCGRSAVVELSKTCPGASIALIDPLRRSQKTRRVNYYPTYAVSFQPQQRTVQLSDGQVLAYNHAILFATGAHGAPPPNYLFDTKARSRIYELRPTILPAPGQRPILSPENVSMTLLGNPNTHVAVLGSGWDAIDLAVSLSNRKGPKAFLLFGTYGPVSHILPNYLSAAIAKRLRNKKIQIHDRTLIRYVTYDEQSSKLQLYTARSFDFLDSHRYSCDFMVIAPEVSGIRGSAVQTTNRVPQFLEESRDGRSWYVPWSNLAMNNANEPALIACYKDDGRISVNPELSSCSGVYAAGSCAKYANGLNGHAEVAGGGIDDARAAGKVAAHNMAQNYLASTKFSSSTSESIVFVKDPIPIWRSDQRSYTVTSDASCLDELGIYALAVGSCDSDRLMTHAVWWTNMSAQKRMMRMFDEDLPESERKNRMKNATRSVYGVGVIFYMDRTGRIQGVMTWGLPFTNEGGTLNEVLVNEMKELVRSNGAFGSLETDFDYFHISRVLEHESRKLVAYALAGNRDDQLHGPSHQLDGDMDHFPRPLHRFTEARPASIRSAGILKRKDGRGQGLSGEDLFVRYQVPIKDVLPPKPVAGVGYASTESSSRSNKSYTSAQTVHEWAVWEQHELRWDENESVARPPREDALWIRKGDEGRNISARDAIAAAYSAVSAAQRFN